MRSPSIELWRVGSVVCHWSSDFRRIRIVRKGVVLLNETFPSPEAALNSASEMRGYYCLFEELLRDPSQATATRRGKYPRLAHASR